MPAYAYPILGAGWLIWLTPFMLAKRPTKPAQNLDRRARRGYSARSNCVFLVVAGQVLGESAATLADRTVRFLFTARSFSFLDRHTRAWSPVADRRGPQL